MNAEVRSLQTEDFDSLRRLIHARSGIFLNESKSALVESRLASRLRALKLGSYAEYARIAERSCEGDGREFSALLNCITTNTTSFFRESHHFELLAAEVVQPALVRARQSGVKRLRIWSAGCSTGQEPYSIAMTLARAIGDLSGWDIRILASDIDTDVLATAREGIYDRRALAEVPDAMRAQYFDRLQNGQHRIAEPLRQMVAFRQINLVEDRWPIATTFDAIFCRNVVIYFDRTTQRSLVTRFLPLLEPDGIFFAGHSESMHSVAELLELVGPTAYRAAREPRERTPTPVQAAARRPDPPPPPAGVPMSVIHAGDIHASASPSAVRTLLGSCVAACLYDPVSGIGGMNHFMLPEGEETDGAARYGVHAMEMLINALMKLGASRKRLVAKVFGASRVLGASDSPESVQQRNAAFAIEYLETEGIPLVAKKLGGETGMSVHFETHTGRAFVRTLEKSHVDRVAVEERRRMKRMAERPYDPSSEVTLFTSGERP